MVHGMVYGPAVVPRQWLDLLLQLLGVAEVVHGAPGVTGDSGAGDPHPRVGMEPGVAVVLNMALGWHVLHLLVGGGRGSYLNNRACQ